MFSIWQYFNTNYTSQNSRSIKFKFQQIFFFPNRFSTTLNNPSTPLKIMRYRIASEIVRVTTNADPSFHCRPTSLRHPPALLKPTLHQFQYLCPFNYRLVFSVNVYNTLVIYDTVRNLIQRTYGHFVPRISEHKPVDTCSEQEE
jgi:hypothetical protein